MARSTASAWRGAGLIPLDRKKALRYLPSGTEVHQPIVESPSCSPIKKGLAPVYLNGSPETGALQRASETVQEHLQRPIRKHRREQAVRSERHPTNDLTLESENVNLRNLSNKTRDVKKGKPAVLEKNLHKLSNKTRDVKKRKPAVLGNKFSETRDELRDGVLDAEKKSFDRSTKRRKNSNKRSSRTS